MSLDIVLETREGARIAHLEARVVGQQRPDHSSGPSPSLVAASSTVPPYSSNLQPVRGVKPTAASIPVKAAVE